MIKEKKEHHVRKTARLLGQDKARRKKAKPTFFGKGRPRKKLKPRLPQVQAELLPARIENISDNEKMNPLEVHDTIQEGMLSVEHALFSQATHERKRLAKLSGAREVLEGRLFDRDRLAGLPIEQALSAYLLLRESISDSTQFHLALHTILSDSATIDRFLRMMEHSNTTGNGSKDKKFRGRIKLPNAEFDDPTIEKGVIMELAKAIKNRQSVIEEEEQKKEENE